MKPATFNDHRRFREVDGWRRRPRPSKHEVCDKRLADGQVLRTVISKGRGQYQKKTFSRILKQLEVTEQEFWDAIAGKAVSQRSAAEPRGPEAGRTIPLHVAYGLEHDLGYTPDQLRGMSAEEATRRLEQRLPPEAREPNDH
jgi:hypothetical protein